MVGRVPETATKSRWVWAGALLLVLLTLVVFARALRADFVLWDDDILIYRNPHLTGFDAATLKWAFTDFEYVVRYQPLTWLTWAGIQGLSAGNPHSYHLANLLFHCLNVCLVFLLIRKLLLISRGSEGADRAILICAGLGALLWAINPLRVEAVAWISALLHLQATTFLLLSALFYLEAVFSNLGRRRSSFYWLSVVSYGVSLFSYPIGLPFVLVFLLLDFYPLRRFESGKARWPIWLEKLPFLALACVAVGIMVWARFCLERRSWQPAPLANFGLPERLAQAFYVWAYFVWKPWLPFNLAPVYTALFSFKAGEMRFVVSLIAVVAISVVVLLKRRQWRSLCVAWLCYLAMLVPFLGLTEHPHFASDRYSYVATLPWFVLIASGMLRLWDSVEARKGVLGVAVLIGIIFGVMSFRQVRIWQNSETLFRYVISEVGDDPYRANVQWRLGLALADKGQADEAEAQFREAIRIMPSLANAHEALARTLELRGKTDEALEQYSIALQLAPNAQRHAKVAAVLARQGRSAEGAEEYREALGNKPDWPEILNNLAWLLASDADATVRNGPEAVRLAERACELTGFKKATLVGTLAAAYAEAGQFDKAIEAAQRASALATASGERDVAATNQKLLELYRQKQAYHKPAEGKP